MGAWLNGRELAQQVQGQEFSPQYWNKLKKKDEWTGK
jgi:hypothetical protein